MCMCVCVSIRDLMRPSLRKHYLGIVIIIVIILAFGFENKKRRAHVYVYFDLNLVLKFSVFQRLFVVCPRFRRTVWCSPGCSPDAPGPCRSDSSGAEWKLRCWTLPC